MYGAEYCLEGHLSNAVGDSLLIYLYIFFLLLQTRNLLFSGNHSCLWLLFVNFCYFRINFISPGQCCKFATFVGSFSRFCIIQIVLKIVIQALLLKKTVLWLCAISRNWAWSYCVFVENNSYKQLDMVFVSCCLCKSELKV